MKTQHRQQSAVVRVAALPIRDGDGQMVNLHACLLLLRFVDRHMGSNGMPNQLLPVRTGQRKRVPAKPTPFDYKRFIR